MSKMHTITIANPPRATATATISIPADRALRTGWYLFWTAVWQYIRRPAEHRSGVTFYMWEDR